MSFKIDNQRLHSWMSTGQFIEFGTFRHQVFAVDAGEKDSAPDDTLLLLHGFPESCYSFSGALPGLLRCFKRVVLLDYLGFGFSDKPRLTQFTYSLIDQADVALDVWRQLGVRGGHVLAHDMGDSVLTELLARLNENGPYWFNSGFQSVTFTNGGMVLSKARLRLGQNLLMSAAGPFLSRGVSWYPFFRRQIISAHGNSLLREEQIRDLHDAITYRSWPGLTHHLIGYLRERLRFEQARWLPAVQRVKIPIHISWAADDQVAPVAISSYLKERICPQAALTLTNELGHFGQIQDPEKWLQPLHRFWDSLA